MDAPNASDRKSIRQAEKRARLAERERAEVITSIMSTLQGRAWLWDTLSACSIFHTTFVTDPYASAFQEGRRSVGLAILADVMLACPDQYIQAMREANERHHSNHRSPASDLDPLAERHGSPIPDGGDSGALTDSGEPDSDSAEDRNFSSPGHDIYVDRPKA